MRDDTELVIENNLNIKKLQDLIFLIDVLSILNTCLSIDTVDEDYKLIVKTIPIVKSVFYTLVERYAGVSYSEAMEYMRESILNLNTITIR